MIRCKHCAQEIEEGSAVWWLKGTCGNVCDCNPMCDAEGFSGHEPGLDTPPALDRPTVEEWLSR